MAKSTDNSQFTGCNSYIPDLCWDISQTNDYWYTYIDCIPGLETYDIFSIGSYMFYGARHFDYNYHDFRLVLHGPPESSVFSDSYRLFV